MLQAFRDIGYEVDVISGHAAQRKTAINTIKHKIQTGQIYDFVYSESTTMPTLLTEPHHLPLHPIVDFGFFSFCQKNNIPIGLFYRDVYWVFSEYSRSLPFYKAMLAKLFYLYDLVKYNKLINKIYLPSLDL